MRMRSLLARSVASIGLVLAIVSVTACGDAVFSRDVKSSDEDLTGMERLEREADEADIDETAEYSGATDDDGQMTGMDFAAKEDSEAEEKPDEPVKQHAVSAAGESVWSSGSAERITDRAKRQLQRRCDAGSHAACQAVKDNELCADRRAWACNKVGKLYAKGAKGVKKDDEKAKTFWARSCQLSANDCVAHGESIFDGKGVKADPRWAEDLFRMGCTRDYGLCARVGRFYEKRDQKKLAYEYFELGCAGGHSDACQFEKTSKKN